MSGALPPISSMAVVQAPQQGAQATQLTVQATRMLQSYFDILKYIYTGKGLPEGVVVAPMGSIYLNLDGGTNQTFFVKENGTGNLGWISK